MKAPASQNISLVVIYNSSNYYPPTLNAIEILSDYYHKVIVVELDNYSGEDFNHPENVIIHRTNYSNTTIRNRVATFIQFTRQIRKVIKEEKPQMVLFYDAEAALAVYLATRGIKRKPLLWYHVHDTADKKYIIKYSLNDWSLRLEKQIINQLAFFSLPSNERKHHFDLSEFQGQYAFIPNYPLKKIFSEYTTTPPKEEIILVYQGRICEGRGIEEIIRLLPLKIDGKEVRLHLIGLVSSRFQQKLNEIALSNGSEKFVSFLGMIPHRTLPSYTYSCHIGLAIYTADDNMHSTLGTASNKAYEYTACGLPFLYFNNTHFKYHFRDMPWAFSTDLSETSLKEAMKTILDNYEKLSSAARTEFMKELNYEKVFTPLVEKIIEIPNG
jgi:hypothetical protein